MKYIDNFSEIGIPPTNASLDYTIKMFFVGGAGEFGTGLYQVALDLRKLRMTVVAFTVTETVPSYLVVQGDKLFMTYHSETKSAGEDDYSEVEVFQINPHLTSLAQVKLPAKSYVHIAVSNDGRFIAAADYQAGTMDLLEFADGNLKLLDSIRHQGKGPNPIRQASPHLHYAGFTPDSAYLFGADLGTDLIRFYGFGANGLTELPLHNLAVTPGAGPRHLVFSHDGRFAYLVNELNNTVSVLGYYDGHFELIQNITILPKNLSDDAKAKAFAGAIRLSASGNYLFVSNRVAENSVAFYRVNKVTGLLDLKGITETGRHPRDFNIIEDEYVVVAAMDDNELELLLFNEREATLERTESTLPIDKPVCIAVA